MAWSLDVAWASNFAGGSGTTLTFTYGSAVSSGALLACFVSGDPGSVSVTGVTDDVNGAWTRFNQGAPQNTGGQDQIFDAWYFPNSSAGTPVITASFSGSLSVRGIVAGSYVGIRATSPFDVGAGQGQLDPGTGTDAVTTGATGTTAGTNELAIAGMRTSTNVAPTTGTGYTQRLNADLGTNWKAHIEDKNVATAATVTGTWTIDNALGDTYAIVGVFKEASAALTLVGRTVLDYGAD